MGSFSFSSGFASLGRFVRLKRLDNFRQAEGRKALDELLEKYAATSKKGEVGSASQQQ